MFVLISIESLVILLCAAAQAFGGAVPLGPEPIGHNLKCWCWRYEARRAWKPLRSQIETASTNFPLTLTQVGQESSNVGLAVDQACVGVDDG